MLPKALNQMTVPQMPVADVLALARDLGCVGVELRNDLGRSLFDGLAPEAVKEFAAETGQRILAVAEVKAFNHAPTDKIATTRALIESAAAAGAEAVALIPHVGTAPVDRATQRDALRHALVQIMSLLQDNGITGLIEPIGFATSSLRHKADAATILTELGRPACFQIVHDTFHHHLSADTRTYADMTGLVHISGVTASVAAEAMTDAHRVLVDDQDRLGNIQQLQDLAAHRYRGPVSFECFAPDIHQMTDPAHAIAASFGFIASQMTAKAA